MVGRYTTVVFYQEGKKEQKKEKLALVVLCSVIVLWPPVHVIASFQAVFYCIVFRRIHLSKADRGSFHKLDTRLRFLLPRGERGEYRSFR